MFLGGSLVATGEELVACAPRWGRVVDYYEGATDIEGRTGGCYRIKLDDVIKDRPPRDIKNSCSSRLQLITLSREVRIQSSAATQIIPINL